MDVPSSIRTTPRASNCREADKGRRLLSLLAQEGSSSEVAKVSIAGKGAKRSCSSGMHSSLRNLYTMSQHSIAQTVRKEVSLLSRDQSAESFAER
jgi:hypothetical protein